MSTVIKLPDGSFRMYSKGASEIVLKKYVHSIYTKHFNVTFLYALWSSSYYNINIFFLLQIHKY